MAAKCGVLLCQLCFSHTLALPLPSNNRSLFLLVLEAGIDIDLTTLKLIGARGVVIALVGTFLPIAIAVGIAHALGYTGLAAVAAGCTFAPTSLGIAMNVLRQSGIANTPVGQLIVAAAIIDDMVACK
jgi:Kef-type K+ transport system membrane component KefB